MLEKRAVNYSRVVPLLQRKKNVERGLTFPLRQELFLGEVAQKDQA
tara:strand:- start:5567 stop:5704 length:138 start_codon:yes stop_codon:yes gene_type:complete